MPEAIKKEKFLQNSTTVFWNSANLLWPTSYECKCTQHEFSKYKQLLSNQRLKGDWICNFQAKNSFKPDISGMQKSD